MGGSMYERRDSARDEQTEQDPALTALAHVQVVKTPLIAD